MNSTPLVSVIILNWNGKEYLGRCFDSLYQGTYQNFEIIFSDNVSTDGSIEFVRHQYPKIKIIEHDQHIGITVAQNEAIRLAKGKYIFSFNNDTVSDSHLLEELVKTAESDPSVGICGCKTVSYQGHHLLNAGVPLDIFGYPYGHGKPFYADAATFIRKDVFDKVGGFDERFYIYREDIDLYWRVRLYGYKIKIVETAWFHHDSSCVLEKNTYATTDRKRFLSEAHTLCILLKNYSLITLLAILPFYFLINILEILAFGFLKMKWKSPSAIHAKALRWNLKNMKTTWHLRKKIQRERIIGDWEILKVLQKTSGKMMLFREIGLPTVLARNSHYAN